ncbi:MAG: hypothetical protein QGI87_06860, partial [Candidatus Bathyarchaeota archaeon]|nr:hypothetical protein [Candidatus Bathyarchaeota archaeon]
VGRRVAVLVPSWILGIMGFLNRRVIRGVLGWSWGKRCVPGAWGFRCGVSGGGNIYVSGRP